MQEGFFSLGKMGFVVEPLIVAFAHLRRFGEAEKWIERTLREGFGNLCLQVHAQSEKGHLRRLQNRPGEALAELQKALDMDPTPDPVDFQTWALLGEANSRMGRPAEAEAFFKMAMDGPFVWQQPVFKIEAHFLYGRFLLHQDRPAEARAQFENTLKISAKTWHHPLGMALFEAKNGRKKESLDWLEAALGRPYFDKRMVLDEPLFSKTKKTKIFRDLMEKHFLKNK